MPESKNRRNVLLYLAAEGVIPVLGGCAGALAGGPVGGIAGVAVGKAVEKAINLFGQGIVERWRAWFAENPEKAQAAVAELAALPPLEAREVVSSILRELAPEADEDDLLFAMEFLSAIPLSADRALVPDPAGAGRTVPPTVSFDDPRSLLQILPEDIPPYPASAELPSTPYRLVELLGAGGFGAVYRAVSPTLQHLPLAIKFCLDRSLLPALNQERSNLERLMRAGGPGARHVVRLYGYDLDHATPYLVYEFVEGGDLTRLVAARRAARGGPPDPTEVMGWVCQIAEGLAFAHRADLVHRDLKPANVLADGDTLKLADFGLGGVAAARVAARSRIGTSTIDYLSLAEQASLFRGAGTPLYMSPEQRRGAPPDARHDLYALGVVWYQLLIGDVSRELHHGWAKELAVRFGVPADHIALIERCVGWFDERPKDAGELLPLLKDAGGGVSATPALERDSRLPFAADVSALARSGTETALNASQATPTPQPVAPISESRRRVALALLGRLDAAYAELEKLANRRFVTTARYGVVLALGVGAALAVYLAVDGSTKWAVPFLYSLLAWVWYVLLVRFGISVATAAARMRAKALVEEIATEFPGEVAAWGGKAALRHPAIVRQIRAELDPPVAAPPSPTSGLGPEEIAADPTRRVLLVARLKEHARLLTETKDSSDLTWVWLALLWMFVTPGLGGLFSTIPYLWDPGGREKSTMIVLGVIGGSLAVWAFWWAMAAVRRHLARKRDAGIERFVADYPRLVEGWGGRTVLESQESVAALLKMTDPAAEPARPGFFRRLFGG